MESQYKPGGVGVEGGGGDAKEKEVMVANKRTMRCSDVILRFLALALTLVGAVVLGTDKQTKMIPFTVAPSLPPLDVPVTAKWHHLSAFVFLVVADAIACAYAALSLLLTLANRGGGGRKGAALVIIILDLTMVALLFSASGAATAVGVIGYEGNTHVRWNKVCDRYGEFCHKVGAAIALSLLGSVAYFLLVLLSTLNLHKKH